MKVVGIIFLILGIFCLIIVIGAAANGYNAEAVTSSLSSALMLGVLGAYLIHRANQKKQEKEEKEKWEKMNKK